MLQTDETLQNSSRLKIFRQELIDAIPCYPNTPLVKLELVNCPMKQLIAHFINWMDRFISPRRRKVLIWEGFWENRDVKKYGKQLDKLIQSIEAGETLTPFLSRYVHTHGYTSHKKGIAWQGGSGGHKDFALNAYDVHHLHLSPSDGKGRHPGSQGNLLYVMVTRTEILFIMLGNHKSFDDGSLHRQMGRFRVRQGWAIDGVVPPRIPTEDRELVKLMRHGFQSITQVDDKMVVTGFLSSAGTAYAHTRQADRVCEILTQWEPSLDSPDFRRELNTRHKMTLSESGKVSWFFHFGDFGITDAVSKKHFILLPGR